MVAFCKAMAWFSSGRCLESVIVMSILLILIVNKSSIGDRQLTGLDVSFIQYPDLYWSLICDDKLCTVLALRNVVYDMK